MRYLGIDFGSKRVGIAISDEDGDLAFPYSVIKTGNSLMDEILDIVKKENIERIVIGESKNFQGEPNKIMKKLWGFKNELKDKTKIEIIFEPEFLSSAQAEKIQGKNDMIDASAAAIILQSYIDRHRNLSG